MLWVVTSILFDRPVPVVADDLAEARVAFERITGIVLNVRVERVTTVELDVQDFLIDAIESWWAFYTDRADGNDSISDAEFDGCVELMRRSFDAVYALCD